MSGGVMTIKPGAMRNLHWNVNANEWHYYLRGRGQVALFGSGGRGKVAEFKPGDVAYIPQGFGHAIKNVGDEDLEIVQTWDNGQFEEIDLAKWVQSSPRYLLANKLCRGSRNNDYQGLSRHKLRLQLVAQTGSKRAGRGCPLCPIFQTSTCSAIAWRPLDSHRRAVALPPIS
jgi:oxalate decarboxylase/phosphoglucose isomerase-like protein (cupin superfamily)